MNITPSEETISKGHPKGLNVLFATEMWERFNFYGMRAILSLFVAQALAYGDAQASIIYGGFLGLCYLTPMLGGYISDRYLGNRNCILLGGATMAIGQLLLFSSASLYASDLSVARIILWIGLLVIIFGNGFFKPNISSMVGQLYPKNDRRLDSAFTIFYMGINVGALLGNLICSTLGDVKHGDVRDLSAFKWGFLAAGIAMLLGTIIFYFFKNKYIVTPEGKPIGTKPVFDAGAVNTKTEESEKANFTRSSLLFIGFLLIVLTLVFHWSAGSGENISPIKSWLYPFIYASGLSLAVLILTDTTITKVERDRILVLYVVSFFVIFFWSCFEQAGSSLTFIADQQTNTTILGWRMPPSQVQNFNAIFIIIFAFPFSWMWMQLQKKNLEPISPAKQAIGLLLLALGYFILSTQVKNLQHTEKISVIWLAIMYLFHTWGELCLSPIGLSLVAKLAPKRFSSMLMGVWFLANAAGYALAGTLGAILPATGPKFIEAQQKFGIDLKAVLDKQVELSPEQISLLEKANIPHAYPTFAGFTIHNLYEFISVFVILSAAAGILLLLLSPLLKKMMHGVR